VQGSIVIKGRLVGPKSVELDEPVNGKPDVEVIVHPTENADEKSVPNVFDFLLQLPAGTRTRENIDGQILDEREAWGNGK
jgi:hypothetical protein